MKELISTAEAAQYLDVAEQTLANWRWLGTGPKWIRVGGRVKYDRHQLDAWLDAQTQQAV